jgi:hypothetical protein
VVLTLALSAVLLSFVPSRPLELLQIGRPEMTIGAQVTMAKALLAAALAVPLAMLLASASRCASPHALSVALAPALQTTTSARWR